jgi:hypothetical protein
MCLSSLDKSTPWLRGWEFYESLITGWPHPKYSMHWVRYSTGKKNRASVKVKLEHCCVNLRPTSCVTMKPNPANVSYTGAALNCHTDLAYYTYVPGVGLGVYDLSTLLVNVRNYIILDDSTKKN